MESDVELAVHHAVDLARARGCSLACITLRGGAPDAVRAYAEIVLRRLGMACREIITEEAAGRVRLSSIELTR